MLLVSVCFCLTSVGGPCGLRSAWGQPGIAAPCWVTGSGSATSVTGKNCIRPPLSFPKAPNTGWELPGTTWSVQAKRVMRWLRLGDPVFVHMGPPGRPGIGPAQCPPGVVKPRPQASDSRSWRPGGGGAAVLPGPSISCSHVQAAAASLPGNSQSSWAIKSACGHPGIRSGTPGRALRALRQVCLRVRGSLQGAEPAGQARPGCCTRDCVLSQELPGPCGQGCAWAGRRALTVALKSDL